MITCEGESHGTCDTGWCVLRVSHDGYLYLLARSWLRSQNMKLHLHQCFQLQIHNWFRAKCFTGPIETGFTADSQTREESKWSRGPGVSACVSAVVERERFSLLHYSSNWHNDNTMCGVSAAADSDLSRMAHCLVSGTSDMLMHQNKIKPDTLIDLGMYNWEMQGRALFSATLTYCILYCIGQTLLRKLLYQWNKMI